MTPRIALISLYDHDAFGARSIYSVLKKNGVEAYHLFYKYYSYRMERPSSTEEDVLVGLLRGLSVDIAGISVSSTFLKEATRLTNRIKRELDICVIWGGVPPTIRPRECIEQADFVFRGEAEESLLEFIRNQDRAYNGAIRGIWAKRAKDVVE